MAHEWFLKPKPMPPDRQESRRTTTTTTTCQHFLKLTVTQAGFQMKTTTGFPLFFSYPSFRLFYGVHLFPTGLWEESRSLTPQGKGQTG